MMMMMMMMRECACLREGRSRERWKHWNVHWWYNSKCQGWLPLSCPLALSPFPQQHICLWPIVSWNSSEHGTFRFGVLSLRLPDSAFSKFPSPVVLLLCRAVSGPMRVPSTWAIPAQNCLGPDSTQSLCQNWWLLYTHSVKNSTVFSWRKNYLTLLI